MVGESLDRYSRGQICKCVPVSVLLGGCRRHPCSFGTKHHSICPARYSVLLSWIDVVFGRCVCFSCIPLGPSFIQSPAMTYCCSLTIGRPPSVHPSHSSKLCCMGFSSQRMFFLFFFVCVSIRGFCCTDRPGPGRLCSRGRSRPTSTLPSSRCITGSYFACAPIDPDRVARCVHHGNPSTPAGSVNVFSWLCVCSLSDCLVG